mmetsp:Transcript_58268/g.189960  ORF Transcript_58268/g.189960 Transcript_58268/m.189960 type:complete len:316 (-) Transcript_58268:731-1678(-)
MLWRNCAAGSTLLNQVSRAALSLRLHWGSCGSSVLCAWTATFRCCTSCCSVLRRGTLLRPANWGVTWPENWQALQMSQRRISSSSTVLFAVSVLRQIGWQPKPFRPQHRRMAVTRRRHVLVCATCSAANWLGGRRPWRRLGLPLVRTGRSPWPFSLSAWTPPKAWSNPLSASCWPSSASRRNSKMRPEKFRGSQSVSPRPSACRRPPSHSSRVPPTRRLVVPSGVVVALVVTRVRKGADAQSPSALPAAALGERRFHLAGRSSEYPVSPSRANRHHGHRLPLLVKPSRVQHRFRHNRRQTHRRQWQWRKGFFVAT